MILTPLQKLPNNVGDLGKIIVATSFECLPKVQKIAKSGHIVHGLETFLDKLAVNFYLNWFASFVISNMYSTPG